MKMSGFYVNLSALHLLAAAVCFAQGDNVRDYANFCYAQLGIKGTDLPDSFACSAGTKLTTFQNGTALKDVAAADANRGGMNFLKTCDTPAWLSSGIAGHQCYDATYLQDITIKGNNDVLGALLCRHKLRDSANLTDFDDIAMILNNKKTGMTCWFQTIDGENPSGSGVIVSRDGRAVPAPHKDAAGFWLKPSSTAAVKCAQCHDNGPWMNSQWVFDQDADFKDRPANKYITPVYMVPAAPPAPAANIFGDWPKTDDFVTVAKAGLEGTDAALTAAEKDAQKKLPTCTSCHKLSAKVKWGASTNQNFSLWFDYTVGNKRPTQATTATAGDYNHTRWMPTERRPANAAAYDKLYAKHFMLLKTCMATAAASRTAPCATRMLALNTAPGGAGAFVSATVIGTGQNVQAFAAPLSATAPPVPVDIAPGSMLQLGWQADSTFEACTIEATMPPGVMVPSSGGSASGSVATGSNWALPQSPPLLGPLTVPGIYDFSLYCGDTYTATVQFQLSGQPPVLLQLATAVNDDVKATAVDSVSSKNLATSTNVRLNDSVELTWIAENVVPDSCSTNGPGLTASGEAGSTTFTFSASSDQLFTFTCQGTDGLPHTLTSTLHLTPAVACDVNGDGKIDSSDISLIMAALNTRALTGDPRDADANGTIDVVDARICTTRCTNKNCAP